MYCENTSTPVWGWSRRIAIAARRPSSVYPGGIRTSTTAASGRYSATAASRSPALPTAARTWWPQSARISARPARTTAESSAITILIGAPVRSRVGRQLNGDHARASGRAAEPQPAVHGPDPLGDPGQPAAGPQLSAAAAVVADPHPQLQAGHVDCLQRGMPGTAVLGDVGEQLGGAEVGYRLARGWRA